MPLHPPLFLCAGGKKGLHKLSRQWMRLYKPEAPAKGLRSRFRLA